MMFYNTKMQLRSKDFSTAEEFVHKQGIKKKTPLKGFASK